LANGILSASFDLKNKLPDSVPSYYRKTYFDLEKEHYFHGRIDKEGDAVILDGFLVGLEAAVGDQKVVDFVADAFYNMRLNYKKATRAGFLKSSTFYRNLKVHKSYTYGDLEYEYTNYITLIYKNFVDVYLSSNRRADKIKNFKDFVKEFVRYSLNICHNYPITKTGFITSIHCSPFVSGMMLEAMPESHGLLHVDALPKYFDDQYYSFWVNHVAKFGFMVDKNAPWRLVFNIGSGYPPEVGADGPEKLTGAQLFMNKYGLSYENVMQYRFTKAYKLETSNLEKEMLSLYKTFYQQYGTYEREEFKLLCDRYINVKVQYTRHNREKPPTFGIPGSVEEVDEYWLKVALKLRLAETRQYHTPQDFASKVKTMIEKYRLFGPDDALKYVNDLTKGFLVTNFNVKGKNWHGVSYNEYEERRRNALKRAEDPRGSHQYSLTGCKNTIGR